MKRTGLAIALVALGVMVPAGTAGATTFGGSCDFSSTGSLAGGDWSFSGGAGTCSGVLNGAEPAGYEVVLDSSGTGSFSCALGVFESGAGSIDFYTVDVFTQAPTFVDSLDVTYRRGVYTSPGQQVIRGIDGAATGMALERGRFRRSNCGPGGVSGDYVGGFEGALSD
jgi:hypothetical protein